MKFPKYISAYIEENKISVENGFYLKTTLSGLIIDIGTCGNYIIASPLTGKQITDYIPALFGMFPLLENQYLPNIQLFHGQYFSLHLLLHDQEVWVFGENVTSKFVSLKTHLSHVENQITHECQLLEKMEFLVLKRDSSGPFVPVSQLPAWAIPLIDDQSKEISTDTHFPFLVNFIEQLPTETNTSHGFKSYSGLWTQNGTDGKEIHLNAWAIEQYGAIYILIRPIDMNITIGENIIQIARENSLAYEQLQKTKKQLEELLQIRDQFVNVVSHDFRSPISTLVNTISYLQEDLVVTQSFNELHKELIAQVKHELERLLNYNNKLYDWVKLNLDTMEVHPTPVSIDNLIMDIFFQFENRLKEKNIEMITEINENLVINTDLVLFSRALINLVDNAIKFTGKGGIITLRIDPVSFTLSDSGSGIDPHKIDLILKGYTVKSSTGTKGEKGTGLGLNIVYRIIKALNYRLDIQSAQDKGTTFIIYFNP